MSPSGMLLGEAICVTNRLRATFPAEALARLDPLVAFFWVAITNDAPNALGVYSSSPLVILIKWYLPFLLPS
jgi:hypothetical protein